MSYPDCCHTVNSRLAATMSWSTYICFCNDLTVLCVLHIYRTLQIHLSCRAESTSTQDVLASLRPAVPASGVTRANVSRAHIWDGARRTFLRSKFNAQQPLCVKFTDDVGVTEGAIDQGGPRREFKKAENYIQAVLYCSCVALKTQASVRQAQNH